MGFKQSGDCMPWWNAIDRFHSINQIPKTFPLTILMGSISVSINLKIPVVMLSARCESQLLCARTKGMVGWEKGELPLIKVRCTWNIIGVVVLYLSVFLNRSGPTQHFASTTSCLGYNHENRTAKWTNAKQLLPSNSSVIDKILNDQLSIIN